MAVQRTEVQNDPRVTLLINAYAAAQRTILAQVKAALAAGDITTAGARRRLLADVQRTLTRLGNETDREAAQAVASMYEAGATHAVQRTPGLSIDDVTVSSFNQVNREAVAALQESMLGRLQDARLTIGRQVADVYARQQRLAVAQHLLGAEGSPRIAVTAMTKRLRAEGVTAFLDKTGRRWSLEDYSDMAVRTVTREAVVAGAVNTLSAAGIDLVQVSTHASACPVCQPFEGQIMSLNGGTGSVDGVDVQELVLPPFHPRCAHTIAGYVPALATV